MANKGLSTKKKIIILLTMKTTLILLFFLIDNVYQFPDLKNKIQKNVENNFFLVDRNNIQLPRRNKVHIMKVKYDEVPPVIINAIVALEDKEFFKHRGINMWGVLRSLIKLPFYVFRGARPQGGSTITQQCVRTIFLNQRYSYIRKIREGILAIRLEREIDKKEIMELYLNNLYMGMGCYGIRAGALALFNKSLDELNIEEIALIAGIIKNPSLCLNHNYNRALERRNFVINVMYQNDVITKEEYLHAINRPITYRKQNINSRFLYGQHFADYVVQLAKSYIAQHEEEFTNNSNTFTVHSTIDSKIQKIIENTVRKKMEELSNKLGEWHGTIHNVNKDYLKKLGYEKRMDLLTAYKDNKPYKKNGFIALMLSRKKRTCLLDNGMEIILDKHNKKYDEQLCTGDVFLVIETKEKTYIPYQLPIFQCSLIMVDGEGNVISLVGSNCYNASSYNRAINTKGQIGSVMKIFDLIFLLENGLEPNNILDDSPVNIDNPSAPLWKPNNWDKKFEGPVTLRHAVIMSRNCALVKGITDLDNGMEKFSKFCRNKLNITGYIYPSYILGANEMRLIDLAENIIPLSNGGVRKNLCFFNLVENESIKKTVNLVDNGLPQKIYSDDILFQTYKILSSNRKKGLSKGLNITVHCGCKSGTANNKTRANFVAYGKNWTIVCSIARDDNKNLGLMANESAGVLVAEILNQLNKEQLWSFLPIDKPENIDEILIDLVTGEPIKRDGSEKKELENSNNGKKIQLCVEYVRRKSVH